MATRSETIMLVPMVLFCLLAPSRAAPLPEAWPSETSFSGSEIGQQQDQEKSYLSAGESQGSLGQPTRFKSTISGLLQGYTTTSGKQTTGSNQDAHIKLLRSAAAASAAQLLSLPTSIDAQQQTHQSSLDDYRCAKYCSCSVIQVVDKSTEKRANLTQAHCESSLFTDLLTIDRRTHIIHISLPPRRADDTTTMGHADGITLTTNLNDGQPPPEVGQQRHSFRMPRLIQFNLLREIVIINLRFEVCDSEVFKRGQRMRRLQLNHNRLSRISKACLRHLDKLIELNLNYNQLEELESALFNSLLSLRSLSIAYNKLTELAAHQFANLTNLVSLNLVGNSFKSINLQLFEPMQNSLRLLLLAKNQIKSFIQAPMTNNNNSNKSSNLIQQPMRGDKLINLPGTSSYLIGVVFKNLIKLNVDENKFERIKLLQLHRFFNVKYLSIRENNIATIRDKAFNGLKLIELNLAHNQLQTVSKCAFCNATIKRLVLAHNNISLPQLAAAGSNGADALTSALAASAAAAATSIPRPLALNGTISLQLDDPAPSVRLPSSSVQMPASALALQGPANAPLLASSSQVGDGALAVSSSPNMLILSQSIFGPLFGQLEYLDLSNNQLLADQLELLLEPLLKLEYLNLASTGLDRYLPSPSLFKNLRQLKYLNLSHNQLDQVVAETVEPLVMLEVLDLSHNKFSELEESFLVTVDDIMTSLKVINFGSNPWLCSQCKVAPLYDWILRSPIYNLTCIAPHLAASSAAAEPTRDLAPTSGLEESSSQPDLVGSAASQPPNSIGEPEAIAPLGRRLLVRGPQHYSLLVGNDDTATDQQGAKGSPMDAPMDMDLILGGGVRDEEMVAGHYSLLASDYLYNNGGPGKGGPISQLAYSPLTEGLASSEDDPSIALTMLKVSGASRGRYAPEEYCLKCEFPSELRSFNIHELQSNDFKFCAGAAPRFAASEPKIGLTLAIVIIGALFCIIIIVIVMYRKKSNTYYTNEETDQLDGGGGGGSGGGKKPVFSISSDAEHQYGDNTDYSSPPMSQSYDSYSQEEDDDNGLDEEEDEDEEGELDEEEEDDVLDEDDDVIDDEEEEDEVLDDIDGENQHHHNHHHHHHEQHDQHNEKGGKGKGDNNTNNNMNHNHHHVGYAIDDVGESNEDLNPQIQAVANAKRMAAAEQERRQQVAEYHQRNENVKGPAGNNNATPATTTADEAAPTRRAASGQASSLSQADRSVSGPVPLSHRRSGSREPAKRQTSAHHHNQHHHPHQPHHGSSSSTRSRPGTAAVAAVAMVAAPTHSEKLVRPAVGRTGTSNSTTPSLVPSSLSGAADGGSPKNRPMGATLSSGHSSTGSVGRANSRTGSGRRHPPMASGSRSQSNQSNSNNSADIGIKATPPTQAAHKADSRATLRSNESLVGGSRSQQQQQHRSSREASVEAPTRQSGHSGNRLMTPQSASGGGSEESPDMMIRQRDDKVMIMMKASQTSDQTAKAAKLRPHSSGGSGGQPHQQQQRQPSMVGTGRPTLVTEPSDEHAQQEVHSRAPKPSGSNGGTASRLGRHRFAFSKEQKSQPAMEWAHLGQPVVEPPTAPHSLGTEQHSAAAAAADVVHHGNTNGLDHASAETLPAAMVAGNGSQRHLHDGHSQFSPVGQALAKATTERRHQHRRSPSVASDDATTADSLALEALSYTASELEEGGPPDDEDPDPDLDPDADVGGALEMDSSGSFGPDEFVNNNNNNSNNNNVNESNNRHRQQQHNIAGSGRLQASGGHSQMRESHSSHSALTQTGSRDEMM